MLQSLLDHFDRQVESGELAAVAVQTVFEGHAVNRFEKLRENQTKYDLRIPFGHDDQYPRPSIMTEFRTGGTPWFIVVDKDQRVVYNDFHVGLNDAVRIIEKAMAGDGATIESNSIFSAVDDRENSRYLVKFTANEFGFVSYRRKGNVLYLDHAEVPKKLRGKGYSSILMEAVLEKIESQAFSVVPVCTYIISYFGRFKRWAPLLNN